MIVNVFHQIEQIPIGSFDAIDDFLAVDSSWTWISCLCFQCNEEGNRKIAGDNSLRVGITLLFFTHDYFTFPQPSGRK
jgi:hypothetical protein